MSRSTLAAAANRVAVLLFRRLPWLGVFWARHHRFVESRDVPWAPLRRQLREATVALVTTAGVHCRRDPPFDMDDPEGDPSFREIPLDIDPRELTITHRYYDHSAADRDINVVFPIDRLRELVAEGRVGRLAPHGYGFMGHIDGRHVATLVATTAPATAARLVADKVDAVFLTPA